MTEKESISKTLEYYNKNAGSFTEGTQDVDFAMMQDSFLEYIPKGGYILDFGCGSGRDARYFKEKGFRVDAVDGSEEMVRVAAAHSGLPVRLMLFQDLDAEEEYDGIWACSSILHLDRAELAEVMQKIRAALRPGGILYTSFKYGEFSGERNGRFFTDMTEESFGRLLEDTGGFEIIRLWITSDVRPGRDSEKWLNVLLRKTE